MIESEDESIEERKRFDHSSFDKMYNHVCDTGLPTGTVAQICRLGKQLNKDSKRPLLIPVCNENAKRQPFGKLYKLKNALEFKGISVSHDMTKDERLNIKLLVEKAKEKGKRKCFKTLDFQGAGSTTGTKNCKTADSPSKLKSIEYNVSNVIADKNVNVKKHERNRKI